MMIRFYYLNCMNETNARTFLLGETSHNLGNLRLGMCGVW